MQKVRGEPPNLAQADHYRPLPPDIHGWLARGTSTCAAKDGRHILA